MNPARVLQFESKFLGQGQNVLFRVDGRRDVNVCSVGIIDTGKILFHRIRVISAERVFFESPTFAIAVTDGPIPARATRVTVGRDASPRGFEETAIGLLDKYAFGRVDGFPGAKPVPLFADIRLFVGGHFGQLAPVLDFKILVRHNEIGLSNVKRNLDAATQFANAFVVHTGKRTVQKTVAKFNIVDHFKEPGNAHKRINLFAIEQAGNLDFVIAVDFAGGVF